MNEYEIINADAERIAGAIYSSIGEVVPAVPDLVRWTEENFGLRINIEYRKMNIGHSGLVYPSSLSGKTYTVLVNSREPGYRQRFTLCHEIAHIVKNTELSFGFSNGNIYSKLGVERFCNRFAASFLMPANIFIEKWKNYSDKDILKKARIANFFKVSGDAVHYRAKELQLI